MKDIKPIITKQYKQLIGIGVFTIQITKIYQEFNFKKKKSDYLILKCISKLYYL